MIKVALDKTGKNPTEAAKKSNMTRYAYLKEIKIHLHKVYGNQPVSSKILYDNPYNEHGSWPVFFEVELSLIDQIIVDLLEDSGIKYVETECEYVLKDITMSLKKGKVPVMDGMEWGMLAMEIGVKRLEKAFPGPKLEGKIG